VDAIVVEGLRKRYGDVQALDGATFGVREGEIFALLGPNGAGKSTAVRVLVTLTQPDAGTARVAGHDAVGDAGAVRRLIGYVPQESGVDRRATGRENLQLQGRVYGMKRADLRRRIDELLEIVGITDAADRTVDGYSGGMRRRLDIALGLVHRPRVLFLDEPTTGLDPEARVSMWEEVGRLASQESLTILLTTHYLEEADELADRLAIVSQGRVVAQGTPNELKSRLIGDAVHVELADGRMEDARRVLESVEAPVETTLADGRTLICGSPTADTRCRGSSLPSRAKEFPSRRCRSTGRASTTSTCTTPAATSPPRTAACEGGARHLVHDRPAGAQPAPRADLDRDPARPTDGVAAPLRPAVRERDAARRVQNGFVHHLPRPCDRRDERVLQRLVERHVDGVRHRAQVRRAVSCDARLASVACPVADRAVGADRGHPGRDHPPRRLLVAAALGVRVHAGFAGWVVILLVAVLVNAAFAGFSQGIALLVRRESTVIALANFISLPLLFLSSTLLAQAQMPHWMSVLSDFNPVNWGVRASRGVVLPGTDWDSVGTHLAHLFALSVVTAAFANWTFRVYKRSL
jgi:ABC-2 type transport system ATP-binding protein